MDDKKPGKKFSQIFMLEVKANSSQEKAIRFLIDTLVTTIQTIFPTAKIGLVKMDRE
jgi:hypothetical protein